MRILINGLSAASGGALAYLRLLVPRLASLAAREGHRVDVLLFADQSERLEDVDGFGRVIVGPTRVGGWRRALRERSYIRQSDRVARPDVYFVPYQVGARLAGVRTVLMLRNMEPFFAERYKYGLRSALRNRALRVMTGYSLRSADRVIAVSAFAHEYATSALRVPTSRIVTIHHGRDKTFEARGPCEIDDVLRGGPFALSCGSLLPYRRFEDIVCAFSSSIAPRWRDAQLLHAGDGNSTEYRRLLERIIARSPFSDRIRILGQVDKRTLRGLYQNCRVFVFATEIEACPNIAIEAMTSGAAIVHASNPPLPEMFDNCGLRFSPRNVEALGATLSGIWEDEAALLELREKAALRAQAFDWDDCAARTLKALVQW